MGRDRKEVKIKRKFYVSSRDVRIVCPRHNCHPCRSKDKLFGERKVSLRSSFFWEVTKIRSVVSLSRNVGSYISTPRNMTEERRSHFQRNGTLKLLAEVILF